MKYLQYIVAVFFLFFLLSSQEVSAQQFGTDTTTITESEPDTTPYVRPKRQKGWTRPRKAMALAFLLPGAGQIYNRQAWKVPILYAGGAFLGYLWVTNQKGYKDMSNAYDYYSQYELDNPGSLYTYEYQGFVYTTSAQIKTERDSYHRYRDINIALSALLYTLSILDAYVYAHLRDFDVSPNLSMSVSPLFYNKYNATFAPGMTLNLKFKNNRLYQNPQ